jgi:hypothetical protein
MISYEKILISCEIVPIPYGWEAWEIVTWMVGDEITEVDHVPSASFTRLSRRANSHVPLARGKVFGFFERAF